MPVTALHFLGWWLLASFVLAGLWAALAELGRRRAGKPSCPHCGFMARQLLAKDEHIAGLERANNAFQRQPLVESVLDDDRSLYLTDANDTVYLAVTAGVWDAAPTSGRYTVYYEDEARPDDAVPLYRLIAQDPPKANTPPADLLDDIEESLAKAKQTLAKPRREERPVPPAVDAPPGGASVGAGGALLPCAPAGSGSRDGGAS